MEIKRDFNRLKLLYEQPRLHLSNHFDAIKNKIDIAFCQKETSSLADDDEAKKWKFLIDKIETLEAACLDSMPSNKFSSEELTSTMSYLSRQKINDNSLKNLIEATEQRINEMLFLNRTIGKFLESNGRDIVGERLASAFLLILNDSHLSPAFIRASLEKLKNYFYHDRRYHEIFKSSILSKDFLQVILIDQVITQQPSLSNNGVNLIEINLSAITHLNLRNHTIHVFSKINIKIKIKNDLLVSKILLT